jgi:hypothetical protein
MFDYGKIGGWLVLAGCFGWALAAGAAEDKPLHQVTAEACKTCHAEIYQQWKSSMHAQSSALAESIHAAFYKNTVGDPTVEDLRDQAGKYPACLKCHAPNAARDQKTKLDARAAYGEGVNCMVCHTLARYRGTAKADGGLQLGIDAYETSEILQGAQGFMDAIGNPSPAHLREEEKLENPHIGVGAEVPLAGNPALFRTSAACLGCHDKRNNPQGVPLCATGAEVEASKNYTPCQSCHMPNIDGRADHSMHGGHHPPTIKRAGVFTLDALPRDGVLEVRASLYNNLPHTLPTGAPFRNMQLKVTAYNAQGQALWDNYQAERADPSAYLAYQLSDEAGHPANPQTATRAGPDNRLKPDETRSWTYEIPARDVALVRGEVYYSLLWPELAQKLAHLPEALRTPRLVWFAEAKF